jgi:hypothetical protein
LSHRQAYGTTVGEAKAVVVTEGGAVHSPPEVAMAKVAWAVAATVGATAAQALEGVGVSSSWDVKVDLPTLHQWDMRASAWGGKNALLRVPTEASGHLHLHRL